MFQNKKSLALFPTTVWSYQIAADTFGRINTGIRNKLDQLIAAAPDKNHTGSWQTAHDLHTLPEMQELNGYFMNAANEVVGLHSTKYKDVEITGCWANIGAPGESHESHTHPNNYLSAVYYVTVPPGGHQITFHEPRHQIHILAPALEETNIHNCVTVSSEVEEGMLLLFPSWLVHSVPVNTSNAWRISIAYNINFSDFTGRVSPPTWDADLPTHPR